MQKIFLLAQTTGEPIDPWLAVKDWPWTWVRVAYYVQKIKSVYEKAAMKDPDNPERAAPLRWVFFDDEALKEWWARFER